MARPIRTGRPDGDLLVPQTMFFADEVRNPKDEIDGRPGRGKAKPAEMAMAVEKVATKIGRAATGTAAA
jgi:DNA end-binding protein Ku